MVRLLPSLSPGRRIESLTARNREKRSPKLAREILRARERAGIRMAESAEARAELVEPDYEGLPEGVGIPEISREDLTPGLIRGAILRHGSLLVRGLIDSGEATRVAGEIDRAFAARETANGGEPAGDGYFEPMQPEGPQAEPPDDVGTARVVVAGGGGLLAVDSPNAAFEMMELFEQAGLRELLSGYLGEPAALSAQKTTLRKAEPSVPGAWHQDGSFLGDVNSLNLWISLSHCGETAPGLDLIPFRLDEIVDSGEGEDGYISIVVTPERALQIAGDAGIARPIFEPGDAMFFDHLCLHQTASDPEMPKPRFAIESWFFGPSAFPETYVPLAY